ncbi:response regulator [Crocosphaera chwakensis]|uniref:Two-component response regulator n=1 Tax=Crocosphaera chwakensis CCY0110 TaxID=391612 RepID=A3IYP7_9CHRO|nr:response regulator [Crocosphaera chwakensis]EAZ88400.1 two-component response regulator [Crocosphaera chwakensis CCY0110]
MLDKAILCVDDEQIVLISLRDQITKNFGDQYLCEIAESVDEAWEIIEELEIEKIKILIIVSDWLMPGVRGDDFLIQVHRLFPQIITVMLTGHADEAAIQRVREEGNLFACIPKPWSESTLIKTITLGLEQDDN